MSSVTRLPDKTAERFLAQRERILDAAQQCFIDYGFHAAGMALIAQKAQISQGLVYRYFENKHALIMAIVQRELIEAKASIRAMRAASDLEGAAFDTFDQWRTADKRLMNAALLMEMSAEASRHSTFAEALRQSDKEIRAEIVAWLGEQFGDSREELAPPLPEARAIALQCFMEGLAVRALREPDIDPERLKQAIACFMQGVIRMTAERS